MDDGGLIWRDGELIPHAEATCHVLSHMAARGSQVFDVLLVTVTDRGPCAVGLRSHVARFLRSAELMGMEKVGEIGELERAVADTVLANRAGRPGQAGHQGPFVVKLIAAWSDPAIGVVPADRRPTVFVAAIAVAGEQVPEVLGRGARVRSSAMPKIPAEILPPSLKVAASYTPGLREQMRSEAEGFDHTVFRTVAGDLAESTTLSLLVMTGGRILAPPLDTVLDGITRRIVLDAADALGIPVDIRAVAWDEVLGADELLLSSTTHPVVPVARLDERDLAAPGPMTASLAEVVERTVSGHHQLSERWLTPLVDSASGTLPARCAPEPVEDQAGNQ